MSCSTSSIAARPRRASISSVRRRVSSGPMPAMGSSSNSTPGRAARASANSTLRCSPCGSVPAARPSSAGSMAHSCASSRACSYRADSAARGRQKRKLLPACACTASTRLSSTLDCLKMLVIWNDRDSPAATRWWALSALTSRPASTSVPASAASVPDSRWMSVDLPAPLGPISAWISPGASDSETWSVASSAPKRRTRPLASRAGVGMEIGVAAPLMPASRVRTTGPSGPVARRTPRTAAAGPAAGASTRSTCEALPPASA
ncbi:MAG: hypothetical protein GAK34_01822 [Delftia tsuruhatensis]|nr:MAG: hypothetical protein GAK34_01822 [Delftia tsuruhatensis]